MLAAAATILATLALAALLCLGALGTLAGAMMAVIAGPDDWPLEIPARPAGLTAAAIGLLVFVVAALALLDLVPHA